MDLQLDWDRSDGVLIASPVGRIDGSNNHAFRDALESGIPSGECTLLLDLRDLSYMSSSGLSILLLLARRFRGRGKAIGMCRLSQMILAVVSLSGFDRIIPVYETRAAALAKMGRPEDSHPAQDLAQVSPTGDEESVSDEVRSGPRRFSFKRHST